VQPFALLQKPKETIMNAPVPNLNRRQFMVGSAAVSSGLAIGLELPFLISSAEAQTTAAALNTPEIGVWVVIRPDDTVVIGKKLRPNSQLRVRV
jgi:secreted PhoX family phosphatase